MTVSHDTEITAGRRLDGDSFIVVDLPTGFIASECHLWKSILSHQRQQIWQVKISPQLLKLANRFTSINKAIADVDSYRATLGAVANRMEHAANNLMSRVEHQQSARSRIQDADYAVESANLAKAQVLQQAGTAMLAQANASSQNILSLLK